MIITTNYRSDNYNIYVGKDVLSHHLTTYTKKYASVYYLVDTHVYELHKTDLLKFVDFPILLPRGELAKSLTVYGEVINELITRGVKRSSLIVAIGGGATGDLVGFVAGTILRGVDYIQVPTTVLAHDSAVGGKTAINVPGGKNLIGRFYRPRSVIMDTSFFETLSTEELLSGYAEVFKHALLNSKFQVDRLIQNHPSEIDLSLLGDSIEMGIETKLSFVNQDEHEKDVRRYLNLGHTLGHAYEVNNQLLHGHAIMFGLLFMMFVSNIKSTHQVFDIDMYTKYFKTIGLDFNKIKDTSIDALIDYLLRDKKNTDDDTIVFVLMKDYGKCYVEHLSIATIKEYYEAFTESLFKDV